MVRHLKTFRKSVKRLKTCLFIEECAFRYIPSVDTMGKRIQREHRLKRGQKKKSKRGREKNLDGKKWAKHLKNLERAKKKRTTITTRTRLNERGKQPSNN